MTNKSGPEWLNLFIGATVALGSAVGVYTSLSSELAVNKSEINGIKRELGEYHLYAEESRKLIQHLLVKDATHDTEEAALKKTQEAAIRAIERMSASAEKLTIAIAKLEERMDRR